MTPKEKAQELVDKMYDVDLLDDEQETSMKYSHAISCALIAVDEIISACEYNHVESYNTEWWNNVKKEIEKL